MGRMRDFARRLRVEELEERRLLSVTVDLASRAEWAVEEAGGDPPNVRRFPPSTTLTMKDARVVAVEFVEEGWLKGWATWFREKASPWRIRDDVDRSEAGAKAFATKALASLSGIRFPVVALVSWKLTLIVEPTLKLDPSAGFRLIRLYCAGGGGSVSVRGVFCRSCA